MTRARPFGRGGRAVAEAVGQLGYVQIDTISVVERAHHHVLFTRIPDYDPTQLDAAMERREIFEYWHHAASFLPMGHFRFALPRMKWYRNRRPTRRPVDTRLVKRVKDRVRSDGPLRARDFESPGGKTTGWWDWKPSKRALELLFHRGELMVSHRDGFQKVYDLTERVLPDKIDTSEPSAADVADHLIDTSLQAHGLVRSRDLGHLRKKDVKDAIRKRLGDRVEQGEILRVDVESEEAFVMARSLERSIRKPESRLRVLSPFDNLVIQRDRLKWLFDFDYQLECYVPAPKRKHGYFCLPLLLGDQFVGRIDAKADRNSRVFTVRKLSWEPTRSRDCEAALDEALADFVSFNQCDEFEFDCQ